MTQDAALDPAIVDAENREANSLNDTGNDTTTAPTTDTAIEPDAPAADEPAPRELTKREQIQENWRKQRASEMAHEVDEENPTPTGMDEPPFVRQLREAQEAQAAADAEAAAAANAPADPEPQDDKSYTLKVRGNDVPVQNKAELRKLAEVDEDDDTPYSDAALIRMAQKQLALSSYLDEVKGEAKQARTAARAPGNTPPDTAATDANDDATTDTSNTPDDPRKRALEAIQYGEGEEAERALDDLVANRVDQTLQARQVRESIARAQDEITEVTTQFEAANADIIGKEYLAQALYSGPVLEEIQADFIKQGLDPAAVKKAMPDVVTALEIYVAAKATGKKVSTPTEILERATTKFREQTGLRKPNTQTPDAPRVKPAPDRQDAKRRLLTQPTRSATPEAPKAQTGDGQTAEKRSAAVMEARKRRGQASYV